MRIGSPKEVFAGEKRVALTPQSAAALKKLGYECIVKSGAGGAARFSNAAYAEADVTVVPTAADLWAQADVVAKVHPPEAAEVAMARPGQILISFLYPAQNPELLDALRAKGVTALAMDMVPRISRAQKMDALSSMANIAGYRAVMRGLAGRYAADTDPLDTLPVRRSPSLVRLRLQRQSKILRPHGGQALRRCSPVPADTATDWSTRSSMRTGSAVFCTGRTRSGCGWEAIRYGVPLPVQAEVDARGDL